ncbi:hypothetical protein B0H16DRAFT_1749436 [Mycena metata]|uniref:Uncharacterized protein n=1 Tax=Mycena metata TaxID=1033252 RepID=A0AAD7DUQ7_9AGAR|nr:hypothetical protein B0H16DRAFT_1749436 [Mycena metata]
MRPDHRFTTTSMPRGRKTKFREDQVHWLLELLPDFESAQRRGKVSSFWPKMERKFFKEWPEETELGLELPVPDDGSANAAPPMADEDAARLGKATLERKKQLKSWFNNNSQKLKRAGDTVSTRKQGSLAVRLFKNLVKRRRRLQEVEIYQKRNKDKIHAAVAYAKSQVDMSSDSDSSSSSDSDGSGSSSSSDSDESSNSDSDNSTSETGDAGGASSSKAGVGGRFKKRAALKSIKLDRRGRAEAMSLRRRVAQALFEKENEEEKGIVRKAYLEQKGHVEDEEFSKAADERTPEQIQSAIDELEGIVAEFHNAIFKMTGWVGVSVLGGPTPEEGGSITQKTFASGESPAGLTLPASLPDWDRVLQGTGQWLKRLECNSRAVRKARALAAKPDAPESASTPTNPPPPPVEKPAPQTKSTASKAKAPPKPKKLGKKALAAAKAASLADWADIYGTEIPLPTGADDTLDPVLGPVSPDRDHGQQDTDLENNVIDPALLEGAAPSATATTETAPDPATVPDPAYASVAKAAHDLDTNAPYVSPIVKEFGALNGAAGVDPADYQFLDANMSSFKYLSTALRVPSTASVVLSPVKTTPRPSPRPAWMNAATTTPLLHGSSPLRGLTTATGTSSRLGPTTPPRHRKLDGVSSATPASGEGLGTALATPTSMSSTSGAVAHSPIRDPSTLATSKISAPTSTPVARNVTSASTPVVDDDVLTPEHFPDSRPLCKPPLAAQVETSHEGTAPPGRGRGRGRGTTRGGGASRGRGRGAGGNIGGGGGNIAGKTAAELGYSFMQTYDGNGNVVPLPLDTVVQPAPTTDSRRIQAMQKTAARGKKGKVAPRKNPLHNPDGHHDLVVFPSPNAPKPGLLDLPAELPEGSKRAKRAPNRDIPMPLSYKSQVMPGAADAAQAKHDAMWVEKLASGKKRAVPGNDENTVPAAKK